LGVAVVARVKLQNLCGKISAEGWHLGPLKKTCGDHYVSRLHYGLFCSDQIALSLWIWPDRGDSHLILNRELKVLDVLLQVGDDLIARHETLWLTAVIFCTG